MTFWVFRLLQGADMSCVDIDSASFQGAVYDLKTIWSDKFDPKAAGCILSQNE